MAATWTRPTRKQIQTGAQWAAIVLGVLIALLLLILLVLEFGNWSGPVSRLASGIAGRPVHIETARFHTLTLRPSLVATGITIENPAWAEDERLGQIERIDVTAKLLPLLTGSLVFTSITIQRPDLVLVRDDQGRDNWALGSDTTATDEGPPDLPVIRDLTIEDGKIAFTDEKRDLTFKGQVSSRNRTDSSGNGEFSFSGDGTYARAPFHLNINGQSLLGVERDKPYSYDLHLEAVKTTIDARGSIPRPFDLNALVAEFDIRGDDLASLYEFTRLALPNTPPYRISGTLVRDRTRMRVDNFQGKIGGSDIAGKVEVTTGERPKMTADLVSNRLNFADLGALLGARVATNTAPVAETGKGQSKSSSAARPAQLLPNAPLDLDRVGGMDANVRYHAKEVNTEDLPLREVTLTVALKDGLLILNPMSFTLPQGVIAGRVSIDARKDVPESTVDLTLNKATLQELFGGGDDPIIQGALKGRLQLTGQGNSVKAAASNADGALALVVPHGQMQKRIAALIGEDIARSLALILSDNEEHTALRCGLAHFKAVDGRVTADTVVLDTDVTKVTGEGTLNLASEALDFRLTGKPKKISLRLRAPIAVTGHLANPSVGIAAGPLVAQAGTAGALSLLTPLASIFAFLDLGRTEEADCKDLLAEAKQSGAPVTKKEQANAPSAE